VHVRVLVVSNLYPPVAFGGYEVECAGVVEHLRRRHDVNVLTSVRGRGQDRTERGVARELALLGADERGALRAPLAAPGAVAAARRALTRSPDLIYVWNGASIPQVALRVLADSGVPLAFRVCEHWFAGLFAADQFMRELIPARRGPVRAVWSTACRAVNALPSLRLAPLAPLRAAICWNAQTLEESVSTPAFVEPVLERVVHSVPRYGDLYAALDRSPAPAPEIVFLGRVTPYKGLPVAIEALAQVRAGAAPGASLEVIGPEDPGHGRELRALARRLGVADAVHWHGQLAPEQAAAALARAHAIIVPSTWDEPFPLVTIEAALARVPIVASDVGGISEGMQDGEHALLFGRGDHEAAARALTRVLREPEETARRSERARERAESFRVGPYMEAQERFVLDAVEALRAAQPLLR
jgi:glycosyltransferase involved in cell wall biosynthesis